VFTLISHALGALRKTVGWGIKPIRPQSRGFCPDEFLLRLPGHRAPDSRRAGPHGHQVLVRAAWSRWAIG
jgi:hypothetical protein